jgi:hypothetical protein
MNKQPNQKNRQREQPLLPLQAPPVARKPLAATPQGATAAVALAVAIEASFRRWYMGGAV